MLSMHVLSLNFKIRMMTPWSNVSGIKSESRMCVMVSSKYKVMLYSFLEIFDGNVILS
jgi:hypothetical protein